MESKRFTREEKLAAIQRLQNGEKASDICEDLKINRATIYIWRKKLGNNGGDGSNRSADDSKELKRVKAELQKLKIMYAEVCLGHN